MTKAFTKKPATLEDLKAVPDSFLAQLVDGELFASPRPALAHTRAASVLGGKLTGPYDLGDGGPGGWWLLDEPELHLGQNVLVPDLAGWRRERVPALPDAAFCMIAPDWVCEVLSPSTAGFDRMRKLPIYLREGVTYVWFIDPSNRAIEAFRQEQGRWVLLGTSGGDERVRLEPFDAVELNLGALWL